MLIELTREERFRQVWVRPITKVAADNGISDVALKKIRDKHCVFRAERPKQNPRRQVRPIFTLDRKMAAPKSRLLAAKVQCNTVFGAGRTGGGY